MSRKHSQTRSKDGKKSTSSIGPPDTPEINNGPRRKKGSTGSSGKIDILTIDHEKNEDKNSKKQGERKVSDMLPISENSTSAISPAIKISESTPKKNDSLNSPTSKDEPVSEIKSNFDNDHENGKSATNIEGNNDKNENEKDEKSLKTPSDYFYRRPDSELSESEY